MDISIITVTWNSAPYITDQLRSVVSACTGLAYEQIVIDNASSDETVALIKKHAPLVRLIENNENMGFTPANNQGVAIARGEFILFLNPDMRFLSGDISPMIELLRRRKNVGVAGCRLVSVDGSPSSEAFPRRFPTILDQLLILLKVPHIWPGVLNRYRMADFRPDQEQTVDTVRGSCMFVRKTLIDTWGWGFDPRYTSWFEDVDLCRETAKAGYAVLYAPLLTCVDLVGQSFRQRDPLWTQKMFTKSMLIYFRKWHPWWQYAVLALGRPVGIGLALIHSRLRRLFAK